MMNYTYSALTFIRHKHQTKHKKLVRAPPTQVNGSDSLTDTPVYAHDENLSPPTNVSNPRQFQTPISATTNQINRSNNIQSLEEISDGNSGPKYRPPRASTWRQRTAFTSLPYTDISGDSSTMNTVPRFKRVNVSDNSAYPTRSVYGDQPYNTHYNHNTHGWLDWMWSRSSIDNTDLLPCNVIASSIYKKLTFD
jgi:hypothetical protein